ncbi:TPA: hypothetical protein TY878_001309 [Streptococcus suis]|nr:hypothetical protein [Streptococcus suis]HEL2100774.1 hypothetical protein [Streptococcus suis]
MIASDTEEGYVFTFFSHCQLTASLLMKIELGIYFGEHEPDWKLAKVAP